MQDLSTLSRSAQRELRKRYGYIKDVIREREAEVGICPQILPKGIVKVKDIDRINEHLKNYSGTKMGALATNAGNLVNLYEIGINGSKIDAHVIWIFKGIDEFEKNRYRHRAYLKGLGIIEKENSGVIFKNSIKPISRDAFEVIYKNPALINYAEELLVQSYKKALEFYNWKNIPKGLFFDSRKCDAWVHNRHVQQYKNDSLGIGIGNDMLKRILLDPSNPKIGMISILVHELIHLQRYDNSEIPAYASTPFFPHNENFQSAHSEDRIDDLNKMQRKLKGEDVTGLISDYEFERYCGLFVAGKEFAKYNADIKERFESDHTKNKLIATRDFMRMIRPSDIKKVKTSGFMDRLISESEFDLLNGVLLFAE